MPRPHGSNPITSDQARAMAAARKTIGKSTGRPRSRKRRCNCGQMTLKRAVARGHKCGELAYN